MTPEARRGALAALDECSRPLTIREIERALRARGLSRSQAITIRASLNHITIIAVHGETE